VFRFRLEPVLKLRRHRRDLVRMVLANVLEQAQETDGRHDSLLADREADLNALREAATGGVLDVDRATALRYHASRLSAEMAANRKERQIIAEQLAQVRQALIIADSDVQALEKLRERHLAEYDRKALIAEDREATDRWNGTAVGVSATSGSATDERLLGTGRTQ